MVNMNKTLPIGKLGEQLIRELYAGKGYVVKDVSDDTAKQRLGYDMVIYPPEETALQWEDENGPIPHKGFTVEVKTDGRIWHTGNLFAETAISRPDGHTQDGWLNTSKAKLLAYIDAKGGIAYFIDLRKLRKYIENNRETLHSSSTPNPYDPGSSCEGYLIPLWKLLENSCVAGYTNVDTRDFIFPERLSS